MQHPVKVISLLMFMFIAQLAQGELVVHEWGTFTSLVGSNGVTQDGMFHEDEALPDFVHGFGAIQPTLNDPFLPIDQDDPIDCDKNIPCALINLQPITMKMETPVVYFYSDKSVDVSVDVLFPQGVISETYPAPASTFPKADDNLPLMNGRTRFDVRVLTKQDSPAAEFMLPQVPEGNIYGHARHVPSNIINAGREYERFIFYRGLGQFHPELKVRSQNGELSITAPAGDGIQSVLLVHVNQSGNARMLPLGEIGAGQTTSLSASRLTEFMKLFPPAGTLKGEAMRAKLIADLQTAGLTEPEAVAMINTWEHGYLKVPGLRLLYILPRSEVESILPMQVTPAPSELERVFVGRIEVMLDTTEAALVEQVLAARDLLEVGSLGRFAEPMLRRAREVYASRAEIDFAVLSVFDRLIQRARGIPV